MVADRIVVAVIPVPDRAQHAVGVEVDGIGAAAHLGRQQGDPVAETLAADVGPAVDALAHDVVALSLGVVGAGVADAVIGDRAAAERIVAQDAGFGGDGRADGGVEHGAPADAAALGRGNSLLAGIGFLLFRQIALELLVILGVDLGAAARIVGGRGPRGKFASF